MANTGTTMQGVAVLGVLPAALGAMFNGHGQAGFLLLLGAVALFWWGSNAEDEVLEAAKRAQQSPRPSPVEQAAAVKQAELVEVSASIELAIAGECTARGIRLLFDKEMSLVMYAGDHFGLESDLDVFGGIGAIPLSELVTLAELELWWAEVADFEGPDEADPWIESADGWSPAAAIATKAAPRFLSLLK